MVEYPAPLIRHGHFPAVGLFCLSMKLSLMIVKYYVFKSVWFCLVYDWIPLLAVYVHMMFLNLNFGKMVFVLKYVLRQILYQQLMFVVNSSLMLLPLIMFLRGFLSLL